ncbi:MAG: DUF2339 domain-containing protein [Ahniella sp.]|nr:DUF2339 domain-containing protein [Ahniella sp.]
MSLGLYFLIGYLTLWSLRTPWARGLGWAHVLWWLAIPIALMLQIDHTFDTRAALAELGDGWRFAAIGLPVLIGTSLLLYRQDWVGMPLQAQLDHYRQRLQVPMLAMVCLGLAVLAFSSGDTRPLPFVPLLNPGELMQWLGLLLLWRWSRQIGEAQEVKSMFTVLMGFAAFGLITLMTLRASHHYGNETWSVEMLTHALPNAALSIVWTVLGIAGMLLGAARRRRALWVAGASVLGVVVLKLLLVDMRLLGTLPGIVSLLTVGVLFVAVGYFAPMPPAAANSAGDGDEGTGPEPQP